MPWQTPRILQPVWGDNMTNTQFMCGVIAELWRKDLRDFNPRDPKFHRVVVEASEEIGEKSLNLIGVEFYVDPITNTVADVFSVASVLQGYGLARRPNPTFPKADLVLSDEACSEILSDFVEEERSLIARFAAIMNERLAYQSLIGS